MKTLSDTEVLLRLRADYLQALQSADYGRIDKVIVPEFWSRFRKYYEEYTKTWKHGWLSRPEVRVVINPQQEKETEFDWMDLVLRGHIDIGPEHQDPA